MKIDETTLSIIKHLRDGKKSLKEIADELGVSENTVRARVNRLRDENIMEIAGLVDPEAIPGHTVIFVGISLQTPELVKKAEEFSKLRGVVSSCVVTGRYDVIMKVLLNKEFGLLEFFTQEMAPVSGGVQSTETFVVYKGFNLMVPYIL